MMMVKVTKWGWGEAVRLSATASASAWHRPLCCTESSTDTNTETNTNIETNTGTNKISAQHQLLLSRGLFAAPRSPTDRENENSHIL